MNNDQVAAALLGLFVLSLVSWLWVGAVFTVRRLLANPLVSTPSDPPVPIRGWTLVLSAILWIFCNLTAGLALRAWRGSGEPTLVEMMVVLSLANFLLLLLLPRMLRVREGLTPADFGLIPGKIGPQLLLGAASAIALAPFVYGVQGFSVLIWKPEAHPIASMLASSMSPAVAVLAFVSAVILAPLVEEILFRGILLGWVLSRLEGRTPHSEFQKMMREQRSGSIDPLAEVEAPSPEVTTSTEPEPRVRRSPWVRFGALLATSALFGLVHYAQWPAPIPLTVLAMAMGGLYLRTGSLVAAVAMHATFNGLSTAAMIAAVLSGQLPDGLPESGS